MQLITVCLDAEATVHKVMLLPSFASFLYKIHRPQLSSDLAVWMQKEEWSSADKTLKVHKSRLELAKEQAAAARSFILPLSLEHARLLRRGDGDARVLARKWSILFLQPCTSHNAACLCPFSAQAGRE